MRVVDLVLAALQQALPERIPAASQGTMNNFASAKMARCLGPTTKPWPEEWVPTAEVLARQPVTRT